MTMKLMYHCAGGDIAIEDAGVAFDDGWFSTVYMMLFSNRRADDDDILPDPNMDRQGWPGDSYFPFPIGSRLWLLSREKRVAEVLYRARDYALEALTPLITIQCASSVDVEARFWERDWVRLYITITAVNAQIIPLSFSLRWEVHDNAVSYTEFRHPNQTG